ncbi:VRR-NUC domain-containing protein [Vibrio sp. vnigr-6D03]|uniref:VRR-NUC domain-containing protein n=1 Tax=Vibrio sp. vnigr-6D03 TaxID=2058088 RepID=UPI000C31F000|nr:VRR-NUC domain-containing protein [Vibrio sp. vnigr-6D03]PKF78888.1 VRR-NUC domain-containing protein [Vibrio sp. vnigr-6D03]
MHPTPELAPDYYHKNFQLLLDHALGIYGDLLLEEELLWIDRFQSLSVSSLCLLIRMLSRKGEWFRSDKLVYEEIEDIQTSLIELEQQRLILLPASLSAKTLAHELLTKPEIVTLFPSTGKSLPKATIIATLPEEEINTGQLQFSCIQLLHANLMPIFTSLFFTNTHQDFTQFVLSDLGLNQFESYKLSRELRYFNQREELDLLLQIGELSNQYYEQRKPTLEQVSHWLSDLPPACAHNDINKKRSHLVNKLARDLERFEQYDSAVDWFSENTLPPSRERRARIWEKQDKNEQALQLVREMIESPYDVDEKEVAQRIERKLLRKLGHKAKPQKKPNIEETFIELDLSQNRVEIASQQHFSHEGWDVFYLENGFLNGLFGLAFWDCIFASVQGAFNHAYQYRPLDLYRPEFSQIREIELDQAFKEFLNCGYETLEKRYIEKQGKANPYVIWELFTPEHIQLAEHALPKEKLADLFKVMLSDMRNFRAGQPDLVAFKGDQFKFIEVKGPGDKLQQNQIRWLHAFQKIGINAEVCYVNFPRKNSK